MPWTGPEDLRAQVQRLWDRGLLLRAIVGDPLEFPRRLQLKTPTSRELSDDYQAVRDWIVRLRSVKGVRIEQKTVHHRVLGTNTLPRSAWLDSLSDAVRMVGKQKDFDLFAELAAQTRERNPALLPWLRERPLQALALAACWPRLLAIVAWVQDNPRPGIYLRQVSIEDIDSKFIEQHRVVLAALLDLALPAQSVDPNAKGIAGFERRYGFRARPLLVRFRILDPRLALSPGSDQDITLTRHDFRVLHQDQAFANLIRRVFITENEVNFLAFPALENALVIFGAGYGFEALDGAAWMLRSQIYYWGDIDTHGFAILDQLRHRYPDVRSLLMNEATLLAHRALWGRESTPETRHLQHLTPQELQLYHDLLSNRFGDQLRLEQERIGYNFLLSSLKEIDRGQ